MAEESQVKHGLADSGARTTTDNGFTREPEGARPDYTGILTARGLDIVPPELIIRIAEHFYRGGLKYAPDNWKLGIDPNSLERNRRSAARHFVDWMNGKDDEDHAAAVAWNMFVYEINRAVAAELAAKAPVVTNEDLGVVACAGVPCSCGDTGLQASNSDR